MSASPTCLRDGTWTSNDVPSTATCCCSKSGDGKPQREIDARRQADLAATSFVRVFFGLCKKHQRLFGPRLASHPGNMRIPFPFPLHVGTDIIQISRLSKPQNHLRKLVLRVLQPIEQQSLHDRFPHWAEDTDPKSSLREWIAGRWAAKEAAKKAWGASLLSFRDLKVEMGDDGDLQVICALLDGEKPTHSCDEQAAKLSISHDGKYAIATVIASTLHEKIVAELRRRKAEAERLVTQRSSESSSSHDVDL